MMNLFRKVAFWEGISYLLLLLVAVPLKRLAGMPEAVRIVGMAHGVLFIAFVGLLIPLVQQKKMTVNMSFFAFVMSLIPFGTFVLEKRLVKEEISPES
jgi:integral membrane protein